jgi:PAS domain-containing protein
MIKIGHKGWMAGSNINGLFCYDFLTKKVERMAKFKCKRMNNSELGLSKIHLYSEIVHIGDYLVLIPLWDNEIAVYDISHNLIRYCAFPGNPESAKAYLGYGYGGYVFFVKSNCKSLFRLDVEKNCVKEINIVDRLGVENWNYREDRFWNGYADMEEEKLYLTILNSNRIVEYDVINDAVQMYRVGEDPIFDISVDSDDIWVTTENGMILRWNKQFGELFKYQISANDVFDEKKCKIFVREGYSYILGAFQNNDVLTISHEDYKVVRKQTNLFENKVMSNKQSWESNFISVRCGKQVFAQYLTGEFCVTDSLEDVFCDAIAIPVKDYLEDEQIGIGESEWADLGDFMEILFSSSPKTKKHCMNNIGNRIFNEIKFS